MVSSSLRRMAAGVSSCPEIFLGFLAFFVFSAFLETRDKSSDYTLGSGGAVAKGFTREAFGIAEGFEAFVFFFFFCGFGGAGASSESACQRIDP